MKPLTKLFDTARSRKTTATSLFTSLPLLAATALPILAPSEANASSGEVIPLLVNKDDLADGYCAVAIYANENIFGSDLYDILDQTMGGTRNIEPTIITSRSFIENNANANGVTRVNFPTEQIISDTYNLDVYVAAIMPQSDGACLDFNQTTRPLDEKFQSEIPTQSSTLYRDDPDEKPKAKTPLLMGVAALKHMRSDHRPALDYMVKIMRPDCAELHPDSTAKTGKNPIEDLYTCALGGNIEKKSTTGTSVNDFSSLNNKYGGQTIYEEGQTAFGDTDGDGIPNYLEADPNNDGCTKDTKKETRIFGTGAEAINVEYCATIKNDTSLGEGYPLFAPPVRVMEALSPECATIHPDPTIDSDGDTLPDFFECSVTGTNPNPGGKDTDKDGVGDFYEYRSTNYGGAPLYLGASKWNDDPDGDGIKNILDPTSLGACVDAGDFNPLAEDFLNCALKKETNRFGVAAYNPSMPPLSVRETVFAQQCNEAHPNKTLNSDSDPIPDNRECILGTNPDESNTTRGPVNDRYTNGRYGGTNLWDNAGTDANGDGVSDTAYLDDDNDGVANIHDITPAGNCIRGFNLAADGTTCDFVGTSVNWTSYDLSAPPENIQKILDRPTYDNGMN